MKALYPPLVGAAGDGPPPFAVEISVRLTLSPNGTVLSNGHIYWQSAVGSA